MEITPPPANKDEITRRERLQLIERIADSPQIQRSARLRQFLLYVGRRAIDGGSPNIPEQEIGSHVFGRPEGYDTGADNIVRVNATELRKRLESYFAAEGAAEPVIVHIPRGGYAPVFLRRTKDAGPASPTAPVSPPSPAAPEPSQATAPQPVPEPSEPAPHASAIQQANAEARPRRGAVFAAAIACALAIACGLLGWQNLQLRRQIAPWKDSSDTAWFWSGFFDSGRDTDIVVADTSFALAEDMSKRQFNLDDYLSFQYKSVTQDPALSAAQRADLALVLERNNGSAGDFRVAEQIVALNPVSPHLRLQFSRQYTPEAVKRDNVVLIGSSQSNPWVDLFEVQMNFSLRYDAARHLPFVENRHPKPGEQAVYEGPSGSGNSEGYSIIAFLPNLSRSANVLILEGTGSQATNAAGDFITSATRIGGFRRGLPVGDPPYFEMLLRTSHLVGTSLRSEVVAYRAYPRNAPPGP